MGHAFFGIGTGFHRAMQNVVLVRRDHKLINRQPHAFGDIACKDITEVAGRHGKAHFAMRRTKADGGGEVIYNLRQTRAPLIEFTPASLTPSRKSKSLNMSFRRA